MRGWPGCVGRDRKLRSADTIIYTKNLVSGGMISELELQVYSKGRGAKRKGVRMPITSVRAIFHNAAFDT